MTAICSRLVIEKVKGHHHEATNCAAPSVKMMASFTDVVLFTVTVCALLTSIFAPESFLQGTQESASGSGDSQQALAPQVRKLLFAMHAYILDDGRFGNDVVGTSCRRYTSVRRQ